MLRDMTVLDRTAPQPTTYTVFGLVDLAGDEPELLVAGVVEAGTDAADTDEYSGPGDRYVRFVRQVSAESAGDAERQCHAYVAEVARAHTFSRWDDSDQQIYDDGVYRRLTPNARAIFAVLASEPERRFTGEQLAAAAGLKNLHGTAGSLSRPRVLCTEVNRIQCWWFGEPAGGRVVYWFDDVHARLFLRAHRDAAAQ
jgi:hypothetical protein